MPQLLKEIGAYGAPIVWMNPGEVDVRIGPCTATTLRSSKIPLDGRYYICAGTVILKNGIQLPANFEINTHTFDFLERGTVKVLVEENQTVYAIDEPELLAFLGVNRDDAFPYKWQTDVPLDYSQGGTYPMKWPE